MIENGLRKKINIKYSDADCNSNLKPFALLNFLQNIADEHAEMTGFGFSHIYSKNLSWFLLKYHIEFYEYPKGEKNLTLITEPRGYLRTFMFRDFEIWEENKNIMRAKSSWVIIHNETHSMMRPSDVLPENKLIKPYVKKEDDLDFSKINSIENVDLRENFKVRYNDLDINSHANNGNYIVWALEPLSFEFRTIHEIKTLDIVYKKEAKYNEIITVEIEQKDDLTTLHSIKNKEGEELCLIQVVWIKI